MITIILSLIYQCYSQNPNCYLPPFNFNQIASYNNYSVLSYPPGSTTPQTISFAPCSSGLPGGCGSLNPPANECGFRANCCAVCQTWIQDTGYAGACLGLSGKPMSIREISSTQVIITYGWGDVVDTKPRQVEIIISCDPTAKVLTFVNFIPATPLIPPPPAYLYTLLLSSSVLCVPPCSVPGFNFNPISSRPSYSFEWISPDGSSEIISLSPCSSGLPKGCGTQGPPFNQCTEKPNCCAVCETWNDNFGTKGACLGLSNHLLNTSAISERAVKLTYGGGDIITITPRQVDVIIFCDPNADELTFIDFIPPVPKNPPPPYYLYTVILSSSMLCESGKTSRLEEIMNKLGELGF